MCERYDRVRAGAVKVKGARQLCVGDIVSVCLPTRALRKLTFQWSAPHYVIVVVSTSTCEVRSLVQGGGKHLVQVIKTGTVPSRVVNKKMTRSYPVPLSFFVGAKVVK